MNKYAEKDRIRAREYYYTHRDDPDFKKKVLERRRWLTANGYDRRWRLKRKGKVLLHYSGKGSVYPGCVRCDYDDIRALSIDHINGGGTAERRTNYRLRGQGVYQYLIQLKFPEGYQTLCMNCQFIKRVENNEAPSWPKPGGGKVYGSGGKRR